MEQETTIKTKALPKHIVLYDGECGLCDHAVQFLLDKDSKQFLHFSPLQGELAQEIIDRHPELQVLDSILYVRSTGSKNMSQDLTKEEHNSPSQQNLEIFWHSSAVVEICKILPSPWNLIRFLRLFPAFLRDWGYRFVARHRIRFFGKVGQCRLPTPSERARFL